jgi:hypothetical protein
VNRVWQKGEFGRCKPTPTRSWPTTRTLYISLSSSSSITKALKSSDHSSSYLHQPSVPSQDVSRTLSLVIWV